MLTRDRIIELRRAVRDHADETTYGLVHDGGHRVLGGLGVAEQLTREELLNLLHTFDVAGPDPSMEEAACCAECRFCSQVGTLRGEDARLDTRCAHPAAKRMPLVHDLRNGIAGTCPLIERPLTLRVSPRAAQLRILTIDGIALEPSVEDDGRTNWHGHDDATHMRYAITVHRERGVDVAWSARATVHRAALRSDDAPDVFVVAYTRELESPEAAAAALEVQLRLLREALGAPPGDMRRVSLAARKPNGERA